MRQPLLIACVGAGLLAPVVFTGLVVAQGVIEPDYDHVAMPISALAAWPLGWLQNVNFYVFGTLMSAFALALHGTIRPTKYGAGGIAILLLGGVGIVLAGVFPWVRINDAPTETPGHVVGAVMTFLGAGIGLVVVSRRMRADPRWSDLARYVLGSGIAILVLFVVMGAFAIDDGAPLHPWTGLLQRAVLAVWFPCIIVTALRALRIAHTRPRVATAPIA